MKTQIITFGLLLVALSVASCKNNETPTETPVTTASLAQADTTMQAPVNVAKDSVKSAKKEENEANEKNEKE